MENKYDVIIIGAGPAGLTAALYAGRANKKTLFIEKGAPGGKMVVTNKIENWIGIESISGAELSTKMLDHAKKYSEFKYGIVTSLVSNNPLEHKVMLESGEVLTAESVIIASGTIERVPADVENIEKFNNKGISYCAICDGPIFKDEVVAVIGGGNSAAEESHYLSSIAKEVHIFVRKPNMRAEETLVNKLNELNNVVIHYNSTVQKINGDTLVNGIEFTQDGNAETLELKAVFPYIGLDPSTNFTGKLKMEFNNNYVVTDENMETSIKGIFAIGDVRDKKIRQISTAVSDGSIAGKMIANR